jgi:hypothetical protein
VVSSRVTCVMIRLRAAIGRYDASIVAHPNGNSSGSRIASRILVYASETVTLDGVVHARGGRGKAVCERCRT